MRFLAMSVCLFVSLVLASTSFYFYIVVSHYFRSKAFEGHKQFISGLIISATEVTTLTEIPPSLLHTPRQVSNHELSLSAEVHKYKEQLVQKLSKKEKEAASVLFRPDRDKNKYKIPPKMRRGTHYASVSSLCRAGFATVDRTFLGIADFEVLDYMPIKTLREVINARLPGLRSTQRSCALVSSAGALKGSKLGREIDAHDLVLRFNDAPTRGFEEDVGGKTTVRIVNSKVISSKAFNVSLPIYKESILVVWDPFVYVSPEEPNEPLPVDFEFFENYKMARSQEPNSPVYILSPGAVWRSWDALQNSTNVPLPKAPPSSGFLGINFLVNFCARISAYEYVPSIRVTHRCHYYDNSSSMGCTFGDWHPLATEKLFALKVNYASDYETAINGKVQISGCVNS